jgi:hypothetical protein
LSAKGRVARRGGTSPEVLCERLNFKNRPKGRFF